MAQIQTIIFEWSKFVSNIGLPVFYFVWQLMSFQPSVYAQNTKNPAYMT